MEDSGVNVTAQMVSTCKYTWAACNSRYKPELRWKNVTVNQADSWNTFTLYRPSAAALTPRRNANILVTTGECDVRWTGRKRFISHWKALTYKANSVPQQKQDLTLHFSKCPHSERVAEDVMADLYPAFVFLLLPLSHLLRYRCLEALGEVGVLPWPSVSMWYSQVWKDKWIISTVAQRAQHSAF